MSGIMARSKGDQLFNRFFDLGSDHGCLGIFRATMDNSMTDYTNVGEVVNIGEIGPSAAVVNHDAIDKGYTQKFKGQINYGSMPLQLGKDIEDAGQVILKAGADGAAKYTVHTWKVTHPAGLVQYFRGMVFSYTTNIGGSNSIVGANTTVELNTPVLYVV